MVTYSLEENQYLLHLSLFYKIIFPYIVVGASEGASEGAYFLHWERLDEFVQLYEV